MVTHALNLSTQKVEVGGAPLVNLSNIVIYIYIHIYCLKGKSNKNIKINPSIGETETEQVDLENL